MWRTDPKYKQAVEALPLPEDKDAKIVYFLWIDRQIMLLWADYLHLKCEIGEVPPYDEKLEHEISEKIKLIDHFEMYLDALRLHITYDEIDKWVEDNEYERTIIYNRF
tara:strand:- start:94 stop:417 length:324 start_codon:yes stop_codon:yes gene_type:complete